jgi:predicted acetyltransferase
LRVVSAEEADPHARRILAAVTRTRIGEMDRPPHWWDVFHRDRERDRHGASNRFWVLHESAAGEVDGYASWRVKQVDVEDNVTRNEVHAAAEVTAADPEVEAALLTMLADIDLSSSLTAWRPVDDPFRLRLVDERRYRTELLHDHLYVRLLDLPVALSARTYASDDEVVLGVDDPFRPRTSGRYRIAGGGCERIGDLHDGDADAFLLVDALGSLYLGDTTARQLAAAGRLEPSSEESLAKVDRLFRTDRAPYCTRDF